MSCALVDVRCGGWTDCMTVQQHGRQCDGVTVWRCMFVTWRYWRSGLMTSMSRCLQSTGVHHLLGCVGCLLSGHKCCHRHTVLLATVMHTCLQCDHGSSTVSGCAWGCVCASTCCEADRQIAKTAQRAGRQCGVVSASHGHTHAQGHVSFHTHICVLVSLRACPGLRISDPVTACFADLASRKACFRVPQRGLGDVCRSGV